MVVSYDQNNLRLSGHVDRLRAWPRDKRQADVSDCVDKAPFIPDAQAAIAGAGHLPAGSSASTRHAALGVFAAMSIAFIWVNSPAVGTYDSIHHTPFSIQLGEVGLSKPLVDWINEGLMVFFFAIGLEIKRDVLVGDLASPRRIALPAIGALGGTGRDRYCTRTRPLVGTWCPRSGQSESLPDGARRIR